MMKAAAAKRWLDSDKVVLASLMALKHAGGDAVLTTCAAPEARKLLKEPG